VCVDYYCRTFYKAIRVGERMDEDMCYEIRRAEACGTRRGTRYFNTFFNIFVSFYFLPVPCRISANVLYECQSPLAEHPPETAFADPLPGVRLREESGEGVRKRREYLSRMPSSNYSR
jgi:hypothetical protein